MRYYINLNKSTAPKERQKEVHGNRYQLFLWTGLSGFALACLYIFYVFIAVIFLDKKIQDNSQVTHFSKDLKINVNQKDLDKITSLQLGKMKWSKKIKSIGKILPREFQIVRIGYDGQTLKIGGVYPNVPGNQNSVVLNDMLNELRGDSLFHHGFKSTQLVSTSNDDFKDWVPFEIIAIR